MINVKIEPGTIIYYNSLVGWVVEVFPKDKNPPHIIGYLIEWANGENSVWRTEYILKAHQRFLDLERQHGL